jgi:hypothetical protein
MANVSSILLFLFLFYFILFYIILFYLLIYFFVVAIRPVWDFLNRILDFCEARRE